ncbi:Protein of uncharacterised function (DUF2637) [Mycobacteroides abscessus subsp. abscessus]|uniref:DUF2637 domain-containing protein n=1 Tax=Mycobacteroides abscessus TaxID=36809 RepID=UPI0009A84354|nr:DUF2637 domain-containing protein [Mycobacteroides abscessus]MBN7388559.1 DUF2637 domain-containing protein [Mycobacteroides abscessus subsp. abscessus]MBN7414829.1 DUF2637 domain-containing protein [Mycobacteroides abscessus subsp. abscessus]MDO2961019.1 DUF2637 domain-containing protein [Mycobacteroides abscessus subsp. abscessus]MDO2994987.1 DUF2637 domain-containing protein [Mycobacteroides abscessus subsp. abscessus]MDO3064360.1 DUF2637 domain-containing protein [Mycobacteroides absces
MSSYVTSTEIAQRHHHRATRFFWTWLAGATAVSLCGNVAHAVLTATTGTRWLAASVAAVPPTVLLASVHGIAVLAKTSASGRVYRAAVTATTGLALGAFLLSFVALRDLAVLAHIPAPLAFVLPLVIDLAIGVATLALVAVGDKPTRRVAQRAAQPQVSKPSATPTAPRPTPSTAPPAAPSAPRTTSTDAPATPRPAPTTAPQKVSDAPTPAPEVLALAERIVSSKSVRQPVNTVARILMLAESESRKNVIADKAGVHHSVVTKVMESAETERRHQLQAVS